MSDNTAEAGYSGAGRLFRCWLMVGAMALLGTLLLSGVTRDVLYDSTALAAGVAIVLAARARRPEPLVAWYLLGAAQILIGLGDVVWDVIRHRGGDPFPSPADGLYFAAYVAAFAAVARLIHHGERDRTALIDACILAAGAATVVWVLIVEPSIQEPAISLAERTFTLGYPVFDLLLFAAAVRLALNRRWRPVHILLLGGISTLLLSDLAFQVAELNGEFSDGTVVDLGWLATGILWGAAALHPSMSSLGSVAAARPGLTRPRTWALLAGSLVGPVTVIASEMAGRPVERSVYLTGTLVLLVLLWVRMNGLMRTLAERMAADREANVAAARSSERRRIARELHDFVTYSLGAVILQAGGARRLLARRPDRTDDVQGALGTIEERSREALGEMRCLLAVLREDEDGSGGGGRLAGVNVLASQVRAAGITLRLDLEGNLASVPANVDLAAFRIVQEALNNVQKHAQGSEATVSVRCLGGELVLEVVDQPASAPSLPQPIDDVRTGPVLSSVGAGPVAATVRPPAPAEPPGLPVAPAGRAGYGLAGMRERAGALGGSVEAGPTAAGGWAVRARLPLRPVGR